MTLPIEVQIAFTWCVLAAIGGNVGMFLEWAAPYIDRIGEAVESVRAHRPNADAQLVLYAVLMPALQDREKLK